VKEGWQTKRLGDVATLQRGFDLPTQNRVAGEFPLVSSSGISDTHHKSAVPGPGVVTGRSGSIGGVFFIDQDFWPLNTVLYVKDFHGNDPRFVFHLLKKFDLQRFASGAGVPTLNRNFVHDELVSVPPFSAQKRIVAILDEAFEGISAAVANAEKNLANARELFDSYLNSVFTRRGQGWVEKKLGECFRLKSGDGLTSKAMNEGAFPVFGGNGIAGMHNEYNLSGDNVIVGRVGALCGNAREAYPVVPGRPICGIVASSARQSRRVQGGRPWRGHEL
jgi:type I restriction enzyme S subunit